MNKRAIYPQIHTYSAYINHGRETNYDVKMETYIRKKHNDDKYYLCHFIKTFRLAFPYSVDIDLFNRDNYHRFLEDIYMFQRNGIIIPEMINESIFILDINQRDNGN